MKNCPDCSEPFEPRKHFNSTIKSKYCDLCTKTRQALKNLERIKKEADAKWKKTKAEKKAELLTVQDWVKITQATFNKYIRLRDEDNVCISCQKPPKKQNAGHFFNANNHWNVRFDEDNVHLQCEHCNTFLSGNLIEYQGNLIKKIGQEKYDALCFIARITRKFSIHELQEINEIYKAKIKNLK